MVRNFLRKTLVAVLATAFSLTSCNNNDGIVEHKASKSDPGFIAHAVLYKGAEKSGLSFDLSVSKEEVDVNKYFYVKYNYEGDFPNIVFKMDETYLDLHNEHYYSKGEVAFHKLFHITDMIGNKILSSEIVYGELSGEPIALDFRGMIYGGNEIDVLTKGTYAFVDEESKYNNFKLIKGERSFKPGDGFVNVFPGLPIPAEHFVDGIYAGMDSMEAPSFFQYRFSEALESYKLNEDGSYDFKGTYDGTLDEIFAFEKLDFAPFGGDTLWSDRMAIVYDTNTYDFNLVVQGTVPDGEELGPTLEGKIILDGDIKDRFSFQTTYVPVEGAYTMLVDRHDNGNIDYSETLYRDEE